MSFMALGSPMPISPEAMEDIRKRERARLGLNGLGVVKTAAPTRVGAGFGSQLAALRTFIGAMQAGTAGSPENVLAKLNYFRDWFRRNERALSSPEWDAFNGALSIAVQQSRRYERQNVAAISQAVRAALEAFIADLRRGPLPNMRATLDIHRQRAQGQRALDPLLAEASRLIQAHEQGAATRTRAEQQAVRDAASRQADVRILLSRLRALVVELERAPSNRAVIDGAVTELVSMRRRAVTLLPDREFAVAEGLFRSANAILARLQRAQTVEARDYATLIMQIEGRLSTLRDWVLPLGIGERITVAAGGEAISDTPRGVREYYTSPPPGLGLEGWGLLLWLKDHWYLVAGGVAALVVLPYALPAIAGTIRGARAVKGAVS